MKKFILDTNNILYAHHEWKRDVTSAPDHSLRRLVLAIEEYAKKYPSYSFLLALDSPSASATSVKNSIAFLAPSPTHGKNADEVIKSTIRSLKSTSACVVVSSDTEVRNYARVNSVDVMSSKEFLSIILPTVQNPISSKEKSSTKKISQRSSKKDVESSKPIGISQSHIKLMREMFDTEIENDDWLDMMK
jgi:hypothetical protein